MRDYKTSKGAKWRAGPAPVDASHSILGDADAQSEKHTPSLFETKEILVRGT